METNNRSWNDEPGTIIAYTTPPIVDRDPGDEDDHLERRLAATIQFFASGVVDLSKSPFYPLWKSALHDASERTEIQQRTKISDAGILPDGTRGRSLETIEREMLEVAEQERQLVGLVKLLESRPVLLPREDLQDVIYDPNDSNDPPPERFVANPEQAAKELWDELIFTPHELRRPALLRCDRPYAAPADLDALAVPYAGTRFAPSALGESLMANRPGLAPIAGEEEDG